VSDRPFSCEPVGPAHVPALEALFERAGSACYCRFFHFEGDKNGWLARLAHEPEANRRELATHVREAALAGVVARLDSGEVVGWMKLEPALELPKLYAQRPYRSLPVFGGDRTRVVSVGCFLVDSAWRRRGVASALLRRGIEVARARGERAVEAFPRRAFGVGDEELWTGPLALFEREGFTVVSEQAQYPVLRLDL